MQRARVNLRRNADGALQLTITGAPEPPVSAVLAKLPKTAFRGLGRWERSRLPRNPLREVVASAVSYGTSIETVSNAIAAAMLETQIANGEGFTAEAPVGLDQSDILAAGSPALMAVGNALFQLTPIAMIDGAKGLKMLREKARKQVVAEAAAMKAQAEAEAARIVQRAAEIEERARESAQALTSSPLGKVPADIMESFPLRSSPLSVGINLSIVVKEFVRNMGTQVNHWAALRQVEARTLLWMPFDPVTGVPDVKRARIDAGARELPHACVNSICVELAREPRPLTDYGSVISLQKQIASAFSVVNLSSLLTHGRRWHRAIQEVCPPDVLRAVNEEILWDAVTTTPTNIERLHPEEDGAEEWTVERAGRR